MAQPPSLAIKLFGTEEPITPMRTLHAGPLSAEFDTGSLRFIKIHGREAIRSIAFVVRDKDWGTYIPAIENLTIEQKSDHFSVRFDAICKDASQELHYNASITGHADGTLEFTGKGHAITDFVTNRTGFVVLHPIVGVSGFPVEVEHVDGHVESTVFPDLIDPIQPFKDIRSLSHEVLPGVSVKCRMDGDTFEMEDQRQWGDASYKTYVRPIGLPWPFTLAAGETTEQSVTLSVIGSASAGSATADDAITLTISDTQGIMPHIGLGLEPQHTQAALQHKDLLNHIAPQIMMCWHDLRAGHGAAQLAQAQELADSIGADLVLEAVIPCEDYSAEIQKIAQQAKEAKASFKAVSCSPADYLKSIMPGSQWPDVPPLETIYDAVRAAFPNASVGGGMLAYFPELNRKHPPLDHIDYITHTSNVITHAGDDITVTENLETLPYIVKTCRSFSSDKPYWVGPSSIGMRFNPYGAKTMDNPNNQRIAMARMDPRQRGLINAAWTLGYAAHMARGDLKTITLHAPVGEFGLIYHSMAWPQPWYDDAPALVYPAYHIVAGLTAAAGAARLNSVSDNTHDVECLAYRIGQKTTVWVANLTATEQQARIAGLPTATARRCTLDTTTFEQCATHADGFAMTARTGHCDRLVLSPYAVVRIDIDG